MSFGHVLHLNVAESAMTVQTLSSIGPWNSFSLRVMQTILIDDLTEMQNIPRGGRADVSAPIRWARVLSAPF